MGCAPLGSPGLRREAFNNSVFPTVDEWATPVFQNDLRPSADLSAFMAHSPFPQEELPPYSEQLLEGHITLMRGTKREDDLNTSLLTARDISMGAPPTENQTQTTDEGFQDEIALPSVRATEVSEQVPFTTNGCGEQPYVNVTYSDRYNIVPANTVPHARLSVLPNPFVEISSNIAPPPLAPITFQRPVRSISTDNSNMTMAESVCRDQASGIQQQITLLPPPRSLSIHDNTSTRPSFPTRPLHLPPLQNHSGVEQPNQRRKKSRRRRGHSWHGESINTQELMVNSSAMVRVTE